MDGHGDFFDPEHEAFRSAVRQLGAVGAVGAGELPWPSATVRCHDVTALARSQYSFP
jgi:hypothetical protein